MLSEFQDGDDLSAECFNDFGLSLSRDVIDENVLVGAANSVTFDPEGDVRAGLEDDLDLLHVAVPFRNGFPGLADCVITCLADIQVITRAPGSTSTVRTLEQYGVTWKLLEVI